MQKKVIPGEPVAIKAETFNSFIDAAAAHKSAAAGNSVKSIQDIRPETILIQNNSGSDIVRFGILGIDGVVFDATDNASEFYNNACLKGITPTVADHANAFVIAQEPIKDGKIGRCRVTGLSVVKININTEGDSVCGAETSITALESGTGDCKIIFAPTGTGEKECLVAFGGSGGGVVRAKVQSPEPTGTVDTASVMLLDSAGEVTGSAFDVFLVAGEGDINVAYYAPTIEEDDIVFIQKINADWYLVPGLLELDDCA